MLWRVVLQRRIKYRKYTLKRTFVHVFQNNIDRTIANIKALTTNNTKQKDWHIPHTIRSCEIPLNNYILERFDHDWILKQPIYSTKKNTNCTYFNSYVPIDVAVIE